MRASRLKIGKNSADMLFYEKKVRDDDICVGDRFACAIQRFRCFAPFSCCMNLDNQARKIFGQLVGYTLSWASRMGRPW